MRRSPGGQDVTASTGNREPGPGRQTAAVCGLYCDACSIFIGSHEDPDRLAAFASRMGWSVEQAHCDGCRSQKRTPYCEACTLYACAERRGHTFCGECAEYPCEALDRFKNERPHRLEIYENLARIRETGVDTWLTEVKRRYSCSGCGTLNSAYDLTCRVCGREPGNAYVAAHRQTIVERLAER
jgi:hypothetical protein